MQSPELNRPAKRFASRLHLALDELALPIKLIDRVRSLATLLAVDPSYAMALLSGEQLPEYATLFQICEVTKHTPGYFLDEVDPTTAFTGTRLVKSVSTGADLAIRLPEDIQIAFNESTLLWYYRLRGCIGLGLLPGDYLITLNEADGLPPIIQGRNYLLGQNDGFRLLKCTEVGETRSVFRDEGCNHPATIVPMGTDKAWHKGQGIQHFGLVVTAIRGHQQLSRASLV